MENTNQNTLKKIIIGLVLLIAIGGIVYGGYTLLFKNNGETTQSEVYTCPMHPQIVQDHPGQCPICGMDLVLKTQTGDEQSGHDITNLDVHAVKLSPSQQILANVQTETVKIKQFSGEKTFNGYVKINEKNLAHISTPVMGKIVRMFVNFEGESIRAGQPVFELYSPDLVSTQKEFVLALENYDRIVKSGNEFATGQAKSLVDASWYRLSQWEMTPAQIEEIQRTREIRNTITVYSKYSGIVTKKYVQEGHWPMAGEIIYDVADLSTVWVIANVYESDVQYIKNGQGAEITAASYPGETFNARINFVDPIFDAASRTLQVRIDVSNKNNKLKPDMYVKVKVNTFYSQNTAVPKNAVLRMGENDIVYVEKEEGVYEPKVVRIGYEQDGYYEVLSGLREGEIVVTSGGFLIDSESQIQRGFTSGHEGHDMNKNEEKLKVNPGQDIMKDMEKKQLKEKGKKQKQDVYTCPMHPEIVQNEPGICPICKMNLEKSRKLD
jgi:Cu(I)/Ag(I) efflux system membrane fusion protein